MYCGELIITSLLKVRGLFFKKGNTIQWTCADLLTTWRAFINDVLQVGGVGLSYLCVRIKHLQYFYFDYYLDRKGMLTINLCLLHLLNFYVDPIILNTFYIH